MQMIFSGISSETILEAAEPFIDHKWHLQIKNMMANAQKMIEERKKALQEKGLLKALPSAPASAAAAAAAAVAATVTKSIGKPAAVGATIAAPPVKANNTFTDEKSRKIAMLQVIGKNNHFAQA